MKDTMMLKSGRSYCRIPFHPRNPLFGDRDKSKGIRDGAADLIGAADQFGQRR